LFPATGRGRFDSCVVNLFDSPETMKQVADPDYTIPGFEPEEKSLLRKIEPVAGHSEVAVSTGKGPGRTARSSAEPPVLLPEFGPGQAQASAHKDVGMVPALLVLDAIRIPIMAGQLARGEHPVQVFAR
jgi:hypothetical protein